MIDIRKGDILRCDAEALVNTVNTRGIMGKGIALQFKKAYPDMFKAYEKACKNNEISIGRMHIFETGLLQNPRYIINFPTKDDWQKPSKRHYIEEGLKDLLRIVVEKKIQSIALPPLGCGLGGLHWPDVREMMERAFMGLPSVQVWFFEPGTTPTPERMVNNTPKKPLTEELAAILLTLNNYAVAGYESSWIEVQKLLYFLQLAGQKLRLHYEKGIYGPYADNLRHTMNKLEGHYTVGYGDGSVKTVTPIRLLPGASEEAQKVLDSCGASCSDSLQKLTALIDGFESPYGLELLATVHWVINEDKTDSQSLQAVVAAVREWNTRKAQVMQEKHIHIALRRLQEQGWV